MSHAVARLVLALLLSLLPLRFADARTARDLSARMRVDGLTSEFDALESVFGYNTALDLPEEGVDDSRWGNSNDVNQIRISWDAKYLYLAGEGRTFDNNMILFLDSVVGQGLARMDSLNSWRRNFVFDTTGVSQGAGFSPDVFGATWDRNTSPRLITQLRGQQVQDDVVGPIFNASATFDRNNPGRAMEFAIPWRSVFLAQAGRGTRDTVLTVAGVTDTFQLFPPGTKLKLAAVITAGGDGTGGPDSAPDNTRGHSDQAGESVVVDNYAIIDLDRVDDTGIGGGGPDGVADWDVDPRSRVSFRFPPPIFGLRFCTADLQLDRPAFRPDLAERTRFSITLDPSPDPSDPNNAVRTVNLTANVFDLRGRFVRSLYVAQTRPVLRPNDIAFDAWDGRDERGQFVPAGVYVIRSVLEPNLCRVTRPVVVVR